MFVVLVIRGDGMDEKLRQAYLYDFYGELLNERQRRIYEDFNLNDLSLGEIAKEEGISRQGVSDMVRRCTGKLEGYEKKLHLVEKFLSVKRDVEQIHGLAGQLYGCFIQEGNQPDADDMPEDIITRIEAISNQILEEL